MVRTREDGAAFLSAWVCAVPPMGFSDSSSYRVMLSPSALQSFKCRTQRDHCAEKDFKQLLNFKSMLKFKAYLRGCRICSRLLGIQSCARCRNAKVDIVPYDNYKSGGICIYTQSQSYFQAVDLNLVTLFVKGQTFVPIRMSLPFYLLQRQSFILFLNLNV